LNIKLEQHFQSWISTYVPKAWLDNGELILKPLPGDAGFRRYFRIKSQPSLIAVSSPPDKENNASFVSISLAFQVSSIRTPKIYAIDFHNGFMLLEDLGEQLLHPLLNHNTVNSYYNKAESILIDMQSVSNDTDIFPKYDRENLEHELSLFKSWFIDRLLSSEVNNNGENILRGISTLLTENALHQPQGIVHKDFHSRNIMLMKSKELAIIDYQDAVIGPITYDLVSLLKDCYISWPREMIIARVLNFKRQLQAKMIIEDADDLTFIKWFDLMGLQRHIKVLGIFSRLALRDSKPNYLKDLPLVVEYVMDVSLRYSDTSTFGKWFKKTIYPILATQDWYSKR
jgi:aminoglycoside/choline kinase family phosphotransferase